MTAAVAAPELVLTAWSAVSPYGIGAEPFRAGVLSGQPALDERGEDVAGPFPMAGLIPDFSPAGYLGRKGTRAMDRLTGIAVAAVGLLVRDCGPGLTAEPERIGLVLGTGSGSAQSIMDFTMESLASDRPYLVDPARFPNTVMNKAAGQSAIWHGLRGPNTTITGDWLTGLLALSYAARVLRGGRSDRVLVGMVEECTPQRAWLEWHAGADTRPAPALGEGGVVFLMEPATAAATAGRTPLANLRVTRFRGYRDDAREALASCVRDALEEADLPPAAVRAVAPLADEGGHAAAERAALAEVLGAGARMLPCRGLIGDTSAAATGFQLAAVLAALAEDPGAGLVTAIDRDGTVGCAVVEVVR